MIYENSDKAISENEFNLSKHMSDVVFKELQVLTGYNPAKSYSRCPSGMSYSEDKRSTEEIAYGTIFNAEGCDRKPFCQFKVVAETRKTFLKKNPTDPFIAMSDYIKREKDNGTAKF